MVISCHLVHEPRPRGYCNHLQCMRAQVQSQLFPNGSSVLQYEVVVKKWTTCLSKIVLCQLIQGENSPQWYAWLNTSSINFIVLIYQWYKFAMANESQPLDLTTSLPTFGSAPTRTSARQSSAPRTSPTEFWTTTKRGARPRSTARTRSMP